MYEELDIPEYLKVSQEDRKAAWANGITTSLFSRKIEAVKPIEQLEEKPADLTLELQALATSAYLNYKLWLKRQVEVDLPSEAVKPVVVSVGKQETGRGHHYAGKLWVLNRKSGERARIMPSELADYEVRGFIKAGPRTR